MNYFEMYKDIWNFHKSFIDRISGDDVFWNSLVDESKKLAKKYNECGFIKGLILNEIEELERVYKEMKNNANRNL